MYTFLPIRYATAQPSRQSYYLYLCLRRPSDDFFVYFSPLISSISFLIAYTFLLFTFNAISTTSPPFSLHACHKHRKLATCYPKRRMIYEIIVQKRENDKVVPQNHKIFEMGIVKMSKYHKNLTLRESKFV